MPENLPLLDSRTLKPIPAKQSKCAPWGFACILLSESLLYKMARDGTVSNGHEFQTQSVNVWNLTVRKNKWRRVEKNRESRRPVGPSLHSAPPISSVPRWEKTNLMNDFKMRCSNIASSTQSRVFSGSLKKSHNELIKIWYNKVGMERGHNGTCL